jgi:hypothetical protein
MLEVERIRTVDLASTRAQAKGVAPTTNHEEGQHCTFARASQTMVAVAMPLNMLRPPKPVGGDPRHRHRTAGGVHPLALGRLCNTPI